MQIEARRIDNNTFDIFLGTQWSDWIRVRKGRSSTYRLAGIRVEHSLLKWLDEVLAHNMPITYGQDMNTMLHNINAINTTH
jgi:hypothetical protein